eukprot:3106393-Rhodomonas_salina.1
MSAPRIAHHARRQIAESAPDSLRKARISSVSVQSWHPHSLSQYRASPTMTCLRITHRALYRLSVHRASPTTASLLEPHIAH